jgi:hypothetical protein
VQISASFRHTDGHFTNSLAVDQFEIHISAAAEAAIDFMAVAARLEAVALQNNFKTEPLLTRFSS